MVTAGEEVATPVAGAPPNNEPEGGGGKPANKPPAPLLGTLLADEAAGDEGTPPKLPNEAAVDERPTELKAEPALAGAPPNSDAEGTAVEAAGAGAPEGGG